MAPPPFAQEDEEEPEEEVIREEKVVKITDDGMFDEKEAGKANLAPYFAVVIAIVLAGLFGYIGGAQIDRAVRANRAIDAALAIHEALLIDQEATKGLKSRISGAARKAIDPDAPGADFTLLAHLNEIRQKRPFSADDWSGHFYQAFKSRQLVFEYYRSVQGLWDIIDDVGQRWSDPTQAKALKAWPEERQRLLKRNATNGSEGFGIAFHAKGGKVLARVGTFEKSRQERDGNKTYYRSDWAPLSGGPRKTLNEYQPGFPDISEEADTWFVRINPDIIVGKKRQLVGPGGPMASAYQDPYRRYLGDLNRLSKSIQVVQSNQDNLIQALADIRVARRPFTFGF